MYDLNVLGSEVNLLHFLGTLRGLKSDALISTDSVFYTVLRKQSMSPLQYVNMRYIPI